MRAGAETRAKRHYGGGVLRLVPPRRPEGTSEAGERKERAIDLAVASQWLACAADRLQAQLLKESRWNSTAASESSPASISGASRLVVHRFGAAAGALP